MAELYTWAATVIAFIIAIAGAWWSGHSKGKTVAEQKATEDKANASVASAQAITEHQSTIVKEASNAEQKVANSSNADVDGELLNDWQRKE